MELILPAMFNRQPHMKEPPDRAPNTTLNVQVTATWQPSRNTAQEQPVRSGDVLKRGAGPVRCLGNGGQPVPDGYRVQWRITNTGAVAKARRAERGGYYSPMTGNRRWEGLLPRCSFAEAFIIRMSDSRGWADLSIQRRDRVRPSNCQGKAGRNARGDKTASSSAKTGEQFMRLVRARSQTYRQASRLLLVQLFFVEPRPVVGAISALIWPKIGPYVAFMSLVIAVLDAAWLDRLQRWKVKLVQRFADSSIASC